MRQVASRRLFIISHDIVSRHMAGPGIRYWELAHSLARHVDVVLAIPGQTDLSSETVRLETYDSGDESHIRQLVEKADVVFGAQDLIHRFPHLSEIEKPLIIDLYTPSLLENLVRHQERPILERDVIHRRELAVLIDLVRRGDFFVCATERQRDFWMGVLTAAHRVDPVAYQRDPGMRQIIEVVPFGIPADAPRATKKVVKGVVPGIDDGDKVIFWGGGIWNWLDPLTPVRAMEKVTEAEPRARLFFLAGRHPNPVTPEAQMAVRAKRIADELGLLNKNVFFHHEWIPYEDRAGFLLEADVAVSAHMEHIETRFSFRTRLLDCIWAGLPMVVSDGDAVADWVKAHRLGVAVRPGDVDGMADGLLDMLHLQPGRAALSSNFKELRSRLTWDKVAQPLVEFCLRPQRAKDTQSTIAGSTE